VGKGGYAIVYRGVRREDGRVIAVKKVEVRRREKGLQVELARTIYIRCTYGIFGREITKHPTPSLELSISH
jgi:hypothetical protein